MGQQPNIEIDAAERPRPAPDRGVERRWHPNRPGEISSPADVPDSAAFGRPGPDAGWAFKLIRLADYDRTARNAELEPVLSTMVGARASHFGRAPVPEDVEVALTLTGLRATDLDPQVVDRLAGLRAEWLDHAAHEPTKGISALEAIPEDLLAETPIRIRSRLNARPDLVG